MKTLSGRLLFGDAVQTPLWLKSSQGLGRRRSGVRPVLLTAEMVKTRNRWHSVSTDHSEPTPQGEAGHLRFSC